ncbi:MAG: hypothetical protein ACI9HX_000612 [Pseudoalteromonas tetraodonis]
MFWHSNPGKALKPVPPIIAIFILSVSMVSA